MRFFWFSPGPKSSRHSRHGWYHFYPSLRLDSSYCGRPFECEWRRHIRTFRKRDNIVIVVRGPRAFYKPTRISLPLHATSNNKSTKQLCFLLVPSDKWNYNSGGCMGWVNWSMDVNDNQHSNRMMNTPRYTLLNHSPRWLTTELSPGTQLTQDMSVMIKSHLTPNRHRFCYPSISSTVFGTDFCNAVEMILLSH
jgi:hypothetical protein